MSDTMTRVFIASPWSRFASLLANALADAPGLKPLPVTEPTESFRLSYGANVDSGALRALGNHLSPLQPQLVVDDTLGRDVRIEIGDPKPLAEFRLLLKTESDELRLRLPGEFEQLGLPPARVEFGSVEKNKMAYGAAPPVVRQVIRWVLARRGIQVSEEKAWSDEDHDINLSVTDPGLESAPRRVKHAVLVVSDDRREADVVAERLREAGFERVIVRGVDELGEAIEPDDMRFTVMPGPFRDTIEGAKLHVIANEAHQRLDVDERRFPLQTLEFGDPAGVLLPIVAYRSGLLRAYAGPFPERFAVRILTDQPARLEALKARLKAAGFKKIEFAALDPDELPRFAVQYGAAGKEPTVLETLRATCEEVRRELGAGDELPLELRESFADDDTDVYVTMPVESLADPGLSDRLKSAAGFRCTIQCADAGTAETLRQRLDSWGFERLVTEEPPELGRPPVRREVVIEYGAAPRPLLERLVQQVSDSFGVRPECRPSRLFLDRDVRIILGPGLLVGEPSATRGRDGTQAPPVWSAREAPEDAGDLLPLVKLEHDRLRVGAVELERVAGPRHPLVPPPELFEHYCLDDITAETLHHVAVSVAMGEPCLLEGETSTSKTSSIQYLASLLDQPVVRLNLHGQTDTGDLIGRWVPQSLGLELPFSPTELLEAPALLEDETRLILENAAKEGRSLRRLEVQQVMANERIHLHPWSWQDGLVVKALRHGWWVILDEVNLAEPQVLERLNSLLEREPQLVLSEHDGSVIGPGGHPVHPRFRIFATMNPAEYAGRTPLSPAYRNRWRGYRIVPPPSEAQYLAMLRRVVFGEQPRITALGRTWSGEATASATHAALGEIAGIERLLEAVARFQVALEAAAGQRPGTRARIGARRKERYVFTRRDLLSVLDYMVSPSLQDQVGPGVQARTAIHRYYLGRVATSEDGTIVADLLDAAGIGPRTWTVELG